MFDLDTYKRISGRLEVDDIDFDAFKDQPLAPENLRVVRYMHDVERHTSCYLRNLLNTKAHFDPDITTFMTLWNFEEQWHGEALGEVLAAHGESSVDRIADMRSRQGWKMTASPVMWMAFSSVTKHFLAVHMTFGVVNEWTTQGGYARLAAIADHPVLSELLRRIMKQEGRHIDYYRSMAVQYLDGSPGAQRTTRLMMKRMWDPVGSKVMPEAETKHLVKTLFSGPEGGAVAARIDRRIDALPGLEGLGLVHKALSTLG